MVQKHMTWLNGATLDEHSKRKHKIVREYFREYLLVRCQTTPAQTKFRLVVVDGFAGGGRYSDGSPGSPVIFIEELQRAVDELNMRRSAAGLDQRLSIECQLFFNDADPGVINMLREVVEPLAATINSNLQHLRLRVVYLAQPFEEAYLDIKAQIAKLGWSNVLFNLDQYGHSMVRLETLRDIMQSTQSAEIFYTFAIEALSSFLSLRNPELLAKQARHLGIPAAKFLPAAEAVPKERLGAAEQVVFEAFKDVAPYNSPFSIQNPHGWRYWLLHFANRHRARQVYNDVLHSNKSQAHYGRAGLNMLAYDPRTEGMLYLFEADDRDRAKNQLLDDIPRMVSRSGDAMSVGEFYANAYNATPAHSDDIHTAMIESPDIEILTDAGGVRRSPKAIASTDTIRLKTQPTFFRLWKDQAP